MRLLLITIGLVYSVVLTETKSKDVFHLDEHWVCNIKKTCFDCLLLPHCSWCETEKKCFSRKLPTFEDFCKDNSTELVDNGCEFITLFQLVFYAHTYLSLIFIIWLQIHTAIPNT